uniref:Uncharacterized protein n=1 Tax=Arundo donax TaxID=35708 RepID=A0A0A9HGX1_ARUDO
MNSRAKLDQSEIPRPTSRYPAPSVPALPTSEGGRKPMADCRRRPAPHSPAW